MVMCHVMQQILQVAGETFFIRIAEDLADLVNFSLVSKWTSQHTTEAVQQLLSRQYPYARVKKRNPLQYYVKVRHLLPLEFKITATDGLLDVLLRIRRAVTETEEFQLRGGQEDIQEAVLKALRLVQPGEDPRALLTLHALLPSVYLLKPPPIPRILALPRHWLDLLIDMQSCPNRSSGA